MTDLYTLQRPWRRAPGLVLLVQSDTVPPGHVGKETDESAVAVPWIASQVQHPPWQNMRREF